MLSQIMRCVSRESLRWSYRIPVAVPRVHSPTASAKLDVNLPRLIRCLAIEAITPQSHGTPLEAESSSVPAGLQELLPTHCCGCGIKLQRDNQNAQG
jgi:hypothetical protein